MKHISLAFLIIFVLFGCVTTPTGNIVVFGEATNGVTEKIDGVIKEYNDAIIQNELTKLAQHKKAITLSKFDPIEKLLIKKADKKNYSLYKANKALGSYAKALSGLSKAGSREEIDLAATKLYGSLSSFNEQYKTLKETEDSLISDDTSAEISRIIAEIGSLYAEKKRGNAIKSIVLAADNPIQKICDVIINELLKGVIEERLFTMRNTELTGYIKDFNAIVAIAKFKDKKKALGDIYTKYIEMQSSSASVKQAIKAIKAIKKAHATLKTELEKDNFTSEALVKVIGNLKDIDEHYDELEEMMLSCETEIVADPQKGIICKKKEVDN